MPDTAVRTLGLLFSVLVAGLTATVLVALGLVVGPVGVEPAAAFDQWILAGLALAAGLLQTIVGVSVYQQYGWARSPGVLLHLLWAVAFGATVAVTGVAIVPLVLCAANGVATVGLFTAGAAFDARRTDISEKHATDIGTGWR